MEEKYIQLTEADYEELIQWLKTLENRVNELEQSVGIMSESPRRTLAKTRIYEEKVGGLSEE